VSQLSQTRIVLLQLLNNDRLRLPLAAIDQRAIATVKSLKELIAGGTLHDAAMAVDTGLGLDGSAGTIP
jgi:hypothetical protein